MQTNLFFSVSSQGADLSKDRKYRYTLWRVWYDSLPKVMFVGLNPSIADASTDDRTIRRCIAFCKAWGYGGFYMLNLFAYRATDPKLMKQAVDPVGPRNDAWLQSVAAISDCVVFCWGVDGSYRGRDKEVIAMFDRPMCMGLTKNGHPKHPLYLPAKTVLEPFTIDL